MARLRAHRDSKPFPGKEISLDMWPAYINARRQDIPGADQKMVFDRFHIVRHVVEAVDTVRKREHKASFAAGDTTLTKSKYLRLYGAENAPQKSRDRFNDLKGAHLKTARVWALKESLRELWE
jgi:transposase